MNLTELYTQNYQSLLKFAHSILKDSSLAEDAVQSTFHKLLLQEEGKTEGHEVQWLFTVCRNTCFKILHKNNRYFELEETTEQKLESESAAPDEELTETEAFSELSDNLADALKKLNPNLQQVVNLRFFKELSYKEIAEEMETTVENVGFLLNSAKTKLRKQFRFVNK